MLRVESKDIERLHKFLKELDAHGPHAGKALPMAAKNGLNTSAFAARREWEKQGRKSMKVRNKWTFGGRHHRVKKARARKSIKQMEAVTGNRLPYMAQQERGFVKTDSKGLQIPTTKSRITASPRRLVSRMYWRKNMRLGPRYNVGHRKFARTRSGGKSREQRYIAGTIRAARAQGARLVYLDFGGTTRGIYDIGKRSKRMLKPVWDMSRRHTRTSRNPMLARTIETLKPYFPQYHRMALEEQIRFVAKKRGLNPRGSGLTGVSRLVP